MSTTHVLAAATGTEAAVIADIAARQAKGIAKYGTTVRNNPLTLRQWLQHQYEELLDAAVYAKRAIEQMECDERIAEVQKLAHDMVEKRHPGAFEHGGLVNGGSFSPAEIHASPAAIAMFGCTPSPHLKPIQVADLNRDAERPAKVEVRDREPRPKVKAWDEINARANAANAVPPTTPTPR